jgi:hypothetical protein
MVDAFAGRGAVFVVTVPIQLTFGNWQLIKFVLKVYVSV